MATIVKRLINEEKRLNLFEFFWHLSSSQRKDWLVTMSNKRETYRANTFEYFINDGEGRRQVCLTFILKTLDISQKYVYYTLSNASYGLSKKDSSRGKTIPSNKTSDATRESVIKFIENLPALPSHYCRKDTTRLYLPVEYRNIKNVYRVYKEDRTSQFLDVVNIDFMCLKRINASNAWGLKLIQMDFWKKKKITSKKKMPQKLD